MSPVTVDFRLLTLDDYEQAAELEPRAFYNAPEEDGAERMREMFPPEWTVGAFVDGKLVADVRAIPQVRRFHGATMRFGAVGPVACAAPYRRRGLVGRLLTMALELMRERGQVLSGLHTPHDALYQRYGWERAESKVGYSFAPKDITLRFRSAGGHIEPAGGPDAWERLAEMYDARMRDANGPFMRVERWWRHAILQTWNQGKRVPTDGVVWVDADGKDQGYVVYLNRGLAPDGGWVPQEVWMRDFVALTGDAYIGLWEHMLTHDLAARISGEFHPDDRFRQLCEDPHKVHVAGGEASMGAMLRVVDVEQAFARRPFAGTRPASFTAQIEDRNLPWNTATWRIEGAEGKMLAERTDAAPDVELSINILASLFSGYLRPRVAVGSGFARLHRPEALPEMEQAFAVLSAPYCQDYY